MANLKLKNGFARLSDATLVVRTVSIIDAMTGNEHFPAPVTGLAEAEQLADEFKTVLAQCGEGNRVTIAIKNTKRDALINALHQLAHYVLLRAKGDLSIAVSSGFQVGKTYAHAAPLSKPGMPVLTSGLNSGEMYMKSPAVPGAAAYLHQYATEDMMQQSYWQNIPTSKSYCTLKSLVPGTRYYCRTVVLGRRDQIIYSEMVNRLCT